MDQIQSIRLFFHVVEDESFSRVANRLGISADVIDRRVAWLEKNLGTPLLDRKGRRMFSVTEFGWIYYERTRKIIAKLDELERFIKQPALKPIGTLRIAVSAFFSLRYLGYFLEEYKIKCPGVSINPVLLDRPFDLVRDGFDVGIADLSTLSHLSYIARPICNEPLIACASPTYLERCGEPWRPDQLIGHSYIALSGLRSSWPGLKIAGHANTVKVSCRPRLIVNNLDFLVQMIVSGAGVGFVPPALVGSELKKGELKPVLAGYSSPAPAIGVIYPSRRHLPAKVRTFVELLVATFDASSIAPIIADLTHS